MVRTLVMVVFVVCLFGVNGMPGKRVRRGVKFNNSGYGSERGGGYHNHGSDERDASDSGEEGGECGGDNYENREFNRDGFNNPNERRHGSRFR